jgi:hypothetical protein
LKYKLKNMNKAISYLVLFLLVLLVFAFKVLIGLAVLSILIVPLTWIYSKIVGQSYNFTIDQSNMLYKLNKFGQWSLVIGLSIIVCNFIVK